ncbi:MAG TPA: efflux RND transporter periplasmic adaptor subunit [Candidatus Desulfobacillus sp.]|nr:efflux RND transporter periplasmic adaptor subunit [Candidatus Desulfobacillus sp.]
MSKPRAILLAVAALLVAAAAAWRFARPPAAPAPGGPAAVPVSLARAAVRDVPLLLGVVGRTEAYDAVTLQPRIDGQVQSVAFTEGRHVSRGELLIRLDPADYQARYEQMQANQAKSQAQLAKARADLERHVALKAKGFVSDEMVGNMRTALAAAEATARADAAAADQARLQLSYTTIRAPFDGIVGARQVSPGAAVKASTTPLVTLNRVRPLYVGFAVPEKYLPALQAALRGGERAMRATISVPGSAAETFVGAVRFIDNGVDPASGTIRLKAELPNEDEKLAPGQFVNVSLQLETMRGAVVIPAEAVQQGSEGPFVFVVRQDAAEPRKIRLAAVQEGTAVVAEGLDGSETVVTEGQLRLTPGARVRAAGAAPKQE